MKSLRPQHVVLPFALLSAAFMLSCSEPGLDPVGLDGVEPQFGKGENKGKPPKDDDAPTVAGSFDVTLTGDVEIVKIGDEEGERKLFGPNGGKNNLQTAFGFPVTINLTDFRALVGDGEKCFKGDSDDGKFDAIMMVSQVTASNIEDAQILFFFDALGTKNDTDVVNYGIAVFGIFEVAKGEGDPPPWPPIDGGSNTITGKTFTLAHNNGPGKKVACTGEGPTEDADFHFTLTVTSTP